MILNKKNNNNKRKKRYIETCGKRVNKKRKMKNKKQKEGE